MTTTSNKAIVGSKIKPQWEMLGNKFEACFDLAPDDALFEAVVALEMLIKYAIVERSMTLCASTYLRAHLSCALTNSLKTMMKGRFP